MWELSNDGTLKNNYSGLCASMKKVKGDVYIADYTSLTNMLVIFSDTN